MSSSLSIVKKNKIKTNKQKNPPNFKNVEEVVEKEQKDQTSKQQGTTWKIGENIPAKKEKGSVNLLKLGSC